MSASVEPTVSQADLVAVGEWYRHTLARTRYRAYLDTGAPSERDAEAALDELTKRSRAYVLALSERVRRSEITVDEWHTVLALEVKRTQVAAVALARGGLARITVADIADGEAVTDAG